MMRSKLSLLSFAVAASLMRFGVVDDEPSAAPSSSEPTGNAAGGASSEGAKPEVASVQGATDGENAGEQGNVGASAAGVSTAAEAAAQSSPVPVAEVGNAALLAGGSSTAAAASAAPAPSDVGASLTAASSPAELSFEQRVEERFLALEGYLMKLPHSIAHAFSQGSAEPEELATRALSHLFSKN